MIDLDRQIRTVQFNQKAEQNRITVAPQSLLNRRVIAFQSIHDRCAFFAKVFVLAIAAQSLYNSCVKTSQSFRNHIAITAHQLCDRCKIAARSLRNRSLAAVNRNVDTA
jgi:hypothetical protein